MRDNIIPHFQNRKDKNMRCEADARVILDKLEILRAEHDERLARIDRRYRNSIILIFGVGVLPYIVMAVWASFN